MNVYARGIRFGKICCEDLKKGMAKQEACYAEVA